MTGPPAPPHDAVADGRGPRVLVCAWAGSTNLGDELVLAGVLVRLRGAGAVPVVLSRDPAATTRDHAVQAVARRDLLGAVRSCDAVVLGGGGLLQDVTSSWNLPYHLAPVAAALAAGLPVVGLGLGAGPLRTRGGRAQVGGLLPRLREVAVRDAGSAEVLRGLGVPTSVTADAAWAGLPARDLPGQATHDVVAVCPRRVAHPHGLARLAPVGVRRRLRRVRVQRGHGAAGRGEDEEQRLSRSAGALADLVAATGLRLRLVALDTAADGPECDALADRLPGSVEAEVVRPSRTTVRDVVGGARLVVATRLHGAVLGLADGRPVVALTYDPKVAQLAAGSRGVGHVPWRPDGGTDLAGAATSLLSSGDSSDAAALAGDRAREGERRHGGVLARLLALS